jgi:hypothetical protein
MAEPKEIPEGAVYIDTSREEPVLYTYKGGHWLKGTVPTEIRVPELWKPVWDALLKGAREDRQAKQEGGEK